MLWNLSERRHGYQAYVVRCIHGFLASDIAIELYHVLADEAPDAIKTGEIKNHFGRKVAIVSCSDTR